MMWGGEGWWLIGAIVMVACMYWMGRMMMSHGSGHAGHDHQDRRQDAGNADEILAERFARGEISEEEFEQRRRVLATLK